MSLQKTALYLRAEVKLNYTIADSPKEIYSVFKIWVIKKECEGLVAEGISK